MKTTIQTSIQRAVIAAGGVGQLANACGVSQQAVYKWIERGRAPLNRCVDIEIATKGAVSRFDLLPEAFCPANAMHVPTANTSAVSA